MNRAMWIRAVGIWCATIMLAAMAPAGELMPPGAPAPSMKRLDQIDPSVCIESLPHTITAPGRYTLCGDLTGAQGQPGIIVLASDVVLDGNGFVLQGVPGSLDGILIEGDQRNVQVSKVVVRGWDAHGVHAPSSSVVCSSVVSSENGGSGFRLNAAVLEDCVGNDNGGDGCDINAARPGRGHVTVLKRCEFSGNTGAGLRCVDGRGLDCDDLRCDSNGADGVSIVGGDGHVTVLKRCESTSNGGSGLHVTGTERLVCEDSGFRDNDSDGDSVGDGVRVVGKTGHVTLLKRCDASGNGGSGLHISDADLLTAEQCTFFSNGQDGMRAEGTQFPSSVIVVRCDSSRNAGSGLQLTDVGGDCDDSRFEGNGGNGITTTFGVADLSVFGYVPEEIRASACVMNNNGGHGLYGSSTADQTSLRVALSSSSLSGNGADGCRVDSSSHSGVSSTVQLSDCVMDRNVGSGLHVTPGHDEDCDGIVERCVANSNGAHGFHVDASSSSRNSGWNLKENKGSYNEEDGMRYGGGGGAGKVSMQDFHFTSNAGHGLHVVTGGGDGSDGLPPSSLELFTHNGRLLDNAGDGLHMARGAGGGAGKVSMQDMHFIRNGGSGADLSCPATIEDSSFSNNTNAGLRARHTKSGHVTLLKRVVASDNGASGISADCDDTDPSSMDLRVIEAVCSRNGEHGVSVAGAPLTDTFSLNFEEIKVTYNAQNGLNVTGGDSGVDCDVSLSRCDAVGNSSTGVHISGSTGGAAGLTPGALSVVATGGRCEDNNGDGMLVSRSSGAGGGAGKVSMQDFHFARNTGSGLSTDCPSSLEACDFSGNTEHGLKLTGKKEFKGHVTLMKRCAATGNELDGVHVETDEADSQMDLHMTEVVCSSNGQNGVSIAPSDLTFAMICAMAALSSSGNGENGVFIDSPVMVNPMRLTVQGSSLVQNGLFGLTTVGESLESCTISDTEASSNGSGGMIMDVHTGHVYSCIASNNGGNGMSITSSLGGVVRDNTCSSNTERGITINTSHVEYASNRCVSNGISGIEVASGSSNVLRDNYLSGNNSFGIVIGSSDNRLYENRTGVQINPLFESSPGLVNDTAPPATAAVRGDPNIGF